MRHRAMRRAVTDARVVVVSVSAEDGGQVRVATSSRHIAEEARQGGRAEDMERVISRAVIDQTWSTQQRRRHGRQRLRRTT